MILRDEGPYWREQPDQADSFSGCHGGMLPKLLHGQETRGWGDSAYSGQREVIRRYAPQAQSFIQTKAHRHRPLSETERTQNRTQSKVRAQVEHAF